MKTICKIFLLRKTCTCSRTCQWHFGFDFHFTSHSADVAIVKHAAPIRYAPIGLLDDCKIVDAKNSFQFYLFVVHRSPLWHPKTSTFEVKHTEFRGISIQSSVLCTGQAASRQTRPIYLYHRTHYTMKNTIRKNKNQTREWYQQKVDRAAHTHIHKHERGKHYAAKAVLCALTYLFDFNRPKKFTRINAKTLIYDENVSGFVRAHAHPFARLTVFNRTGSNSNWRKIAYKYTTGNHWRWIKNVLLQAQTHTHTRCLELSID